MEGIRNSGFEKGDRPLTVDDNGKLYFADEGSTHARFEINWCGNTAEYLEIYYTNSNAA